MTAQIHVKGAIVGNDYKEYYEWFDMESTSPRDVLEALPEGNEDIEVIINSGGGHVDAGSEIYSLLKEYSGQVTVKIVAMAASAASVIAMAGDKVIISPTAQIMIHNVSSIAQGDYNEMLHQAGILQEFNRSIANAYILKTGRSEKEILELMNKETYFSAKKAIEEGFADEIMGVTAENLSSFLVASTNAAALLPMNVIEKMRMDKQSKQPNKTNRKLKFIC